MVLTALIPAAWGWFVVGLTVFGGVVGVAGLAKPRRSRS
jgi:hypothetical protein